MLEYRAKRAKQSDTNTLSVEDTNPDLIDLASTECRECEGPLHEVACQQQSAEPADVVTADLNEEPQSDISVVDTQVDLDAQSGTKDTVLDIKVQALTPQPSSAASWLEDTSVRWDTDKPPTPSAAGGGDILSDTDDDLDPQLCFNPTCGKRACEVTGGLKRCTRCQTAEYCSKACQASHWNFHKAGCNLIARELKH